MSAARVVARVAPLMVPVVILSCGGAPAATSGGPASPGAPAEPAAGPSKIDGNWEIVRYESDRPIPPEAMPLMGDMFDALRVRFEGGMARFEIGKTKESVPFSVQEEDDSGFRLVAKGGMFDGARFKSVGDGRYEVTDKGGTWPGVSVLARAR